MPYPFVTVIRSCENGKSTTCPCV